MKRVSHWAAPPILALALMACQQPAPPAPPPSPEAVPEEAAVLEPEAVVLPCGIVGQRDWQASLTPGASLALTVSGEIDMPTPGFGVSLARDEADESDAAAQLTLQLRPPTVLVTQVVTAHPVRYYGPAAVRYETVQIMCDGEIVTTIEVGG